MRRIGRQGSEGRVLRPDREVPRGLRVSQVLTLIARHPWRYVLSRWNYKSAVTSSLFRAQIFLAANLSAGFDAAFGAMLSEFCYRFLSAGVLGALTQAFRHVEPPRRALHAAMIVLPLVGHSSELLFHWLRGTPNLAVSMAASVAFTAVSTSFNLFAMRQGALIVGEDSRSLWRDLAQMPALLGAFLLSWRSRRFI